MVPSVLRSTLARVLRPWGEARKNLRRKTRYGARAHTHPLSTFEYMPSAKTDTIHLWWCIHSCTHNGFRTVSENGWIKIIRKLLCTIWDFLGCLTAFKPWQHIQGIKLFCLGHPWDQLLIYEKLEGYMINTLVKTPIPVLFFLVLCGARNNFSWLIFENLCQCDNFS